MAHLTITCAECGKDFDTPRKSQKTCSTCRHEAMKARGALKGPCKVDDCEEPQFCKGFCNRHYWADRQRKAPRPSRIYRGTCLWCERPFETTDKRSTHCSLDCGIKTREGWSKSTVVALRRSPERIARSWTGKVLPAREGLALVAGPCAHCGCDFVGRAGSVYCSTRCHENASWRRRYDARGEFYITPRARQEIYARDGWTCQLCGDPVDKDAPANNKWSPTLDHIIPQSMQLIPDHSPSNLRLAHMLCNARRGNKVDAELAA